MPKFVTITLKRFFTFGCNAPPRPAPPPTFIFDRVRYALSAFAAIYYYIEKTISPSYHSRMPPISTHLGLRTFVLVVEPSKHFCFAWLLIVLLQEFPAIKVVFNTHY